jgi:hypothetical protein
MPHDVSADTPVGRVLAAAGGKQKRAGDGWLVRCPAHADGTESLKVAPGRDGRAVLTCHAGCDFADIVTALGLEQKDLFVDRDEPTGTRPASTSLTLVEFCDAKRLDAATLHNFGVNERSHFGRPALEFTYPTLDGGHARTRLRTALGKDGFRWLGQGDVAAYTPDRCALAREERFAVLVEGESDTLTLLCAGIPAIGLPGAKTTEKLTAKHLDGLTCVFLSQEPDAGGDAFVKGCKARLSELEYAGAVHVLKMPPGVKDPSSFYLREPATFTERFHQLLTDASKPPPGPLDGVWRTLSEWGVFSTEPPPRQWLLEQPNPQTNGATRIGVLQLGKTGLLVSPGGVGKTLALVQLALSVATGRAWFDHFTTPNPGRVLIALGEEDADEIHRRAYSVARAMRLTDEQIALAGQNIVAMPLAGVHAALVESAGGRTVETPMLEALRKKLSESEWRLVILDPLSRFAGGDTEKDNAAATRFVEAAESLAKLGGRPSVLIAHHTAKPPRGEGKPARASANDARGASGLIAGVRWVANLESVKGGAQLTVTKSNYAPNGEDVLPLTRDFDQGGYLRAMSPEERKQRTEARVREAAEQMSALQERICVALEEAPGTSKVDLSKLLGVRAQMVRQAVDDLTSMGRVEKVGRYGFRKTGSLVS